jgi:hypothetical protein
MYWSINNDMNVKCSGGSGGPPPAKFGQTECRIVKIRAKSRQLYCSKKRFI